MVKPFPTRIDGEAFTVVLAKPSFWVDSTGTRHIGKLHKTLPPRTKVTRKSKTCSKCKKPAWTTTNRDRALHVSCEGFTDTFPDDVAWTMITNLATHAGATIL